MLQDRLQSFTGPEASLHRPLSKSAFLLRILIARALYLGLVIVIMAFQGHDMNAITVAATQ